MCAPTLLTIFIPIFPPKIHSSPLALRSTMVLPSPPPAPITQRPFPLPCALWYATDWASPSVDRSSTRLHSISWSPDWKIHIYTHLLPLSFADYEYIYLCLFDDCDPSIAEQRGIHLKPSGDRSPPDWGPPKNLSERFHRAISNLRWRYWYRLRSREENLKMAWSVGKGRWMWVCRPARDGRKQR